MRLFLAINIPSGIRKDLRNIAVGLNRFGKFKLVEADNIHITLKFLGEFQPEEIIKPLEGINFKKFDTSLKGVGAFPNLDNTRVIWVGCDNGWRDIVSLHNMIEERLDGINPEKNFHPHATLARVSFTKDKKGLRDFIGKNKGKEFGEYQVNSFELMSSELTRNGPKYEVVKSFGLS